MKVITPKYVEYKPRIQKQFLAARIVVVTLFWSFACWSFIWFFHLVDFFQNQFPTLFDVFYDFIFAKKVAEYIVFVDILPGFITYMCFIKSEKREEVISFCAVPIYVVLATAFFVGLGTLIFNREYFHEGKIMAGTMLSLLLLAPILFGYLASFRFERKVKPLSSN